MKNLIKIIGIVLILSLCFSFFTFEAFADDELEQPQEQLEEEIVEEVEVEAEEVEEIVEETVEEEVEEIVDEVEEEVVEEKVVMNVATVAALTTELEQEQEQKQEPIVEEEESVITYPFTVTYHFYYRGANANWVDVSYSQIVDSEGFNASKAVSYFSKQITNNHFETTSDTNAVYIWLKTWDNGALADGDRVYINTTLFHEDTEIFYYADYSVESKAHLTFICSDSVAHGSSTAANVDIAEGYSHTFSVPKDIPSHYTFLYWQNGDSIFHAGETFSIKLGDLTEDTTITYVAVYSYQPPVQVNYHLKDGVASVTAYEDIDIYASAPTADKWFFEGSDTPIIEGTLATLPEAIVTTEPISAIKEVDVYAKYFTVTYLPGLHGTFKEQSTVVSYGFPTPSAPKVTGDANYVFMGWSPAVSKIVTSDATYTAQWEKHSVGPKTGDDRFIDVEIGNNTITVDMIPVWLAAAVFSLFSAVIIVILIKKKS